MQHMVCSAAEFLHGFNQVFVVQLWEKSLELPLGQVLCLGCQGEDCAPQFQLGRLETHWISNCAIHIWTCVHSWGTTCVTMLRVEKSLQSRYSLHLCQCRADQRLVLSHTPKPSHGWETWTQYEISYSQEVGRKSDKAEREGRCCLSLLPANAHNSVCDGAAFKLPVGV